MYGNVVSAVSQFLTPDLVAKIASASGISDRTMTQKADWGRCACNTL